MPSGSVMSRIQQFEEISSPKSQHSAMSTSPKTPRNFQLSPKNPGQRPPSPGGSSFVASGSGFSRSPSPVRRSPSPVQRPPSPGGIALSPGTPSSTGSNTSSRRKQRPTPGGMIGDSSPKHISSSGTLSPSPGNSIRRRAPSPEGHLRTRSPSPPSVDTEFYGILKENNTTPLPSPVSSERPNMPTRSPSKVRFSFTKDPTGHTPSQINVASNGISPEQEQVDSFNNSPPSNNPIRDNPAFMERLVQVAIEEEEEEEEEEEDNFDMRPETGGTSSSTQHSHSNNVQSLSTHDRPALDNAENNDSSKTIVKLGKKVSALSEKWNEMNARTNKKEAHLKDIVGVKSPKSKWNEINTLPSKNVHSTEDGESSPKPLPSYEQNQLIENPKEQEKREIGTYSVISPRKQPHEGPSPNSNNKAFNYDQNHSLRSHKKLESEEGFLREDWNEIDHKERNAKSQISKSARSKSSPLKENALVKRSKFENFRPVSADSSESGSTMSLDEAKTTASMQRKASEKLLKLRGNNQPEKIDEPPDESENNKSAFTSTSRKATIDRIRSAYKLSTGTSNQSQLGSSRKAVVNKIREERQRKSLFATKEIPKKSTVIHKPAARKATGPILSLSARGRSFDSAPSDEQSLSSQSSTISRGRAIARIRERVQRSRASSVGPQNTNKQVSRAISPTSEISISYDRMKLRDGLSMIKNHYKVKATPLEKYSFNATSRKSQKQGKEEISRSSSTRSRLSVNLARLEKLKEQRHQRGARLSMTKKVDRRDDISLDSLSGSSASIKVQDSTSRSSTSIIMKERTRKDDRSIENSRTSENDSYKKTNKKMSWAEIMQKRLEKNYDSSNSFDSSESWDMDKGLLDLISSESHGSISSQSISALSQNSRSVKDDSNQSYDSFPMLPESKSIDTNYDSNDSEQQSRRKGKREGRYGEEDELLDKWESRREDQDKEQDKQDNRYNKRDANSKINPKRKNDLTSKKNKKGKEKSKERMKKNEKNRKEKGKDRTNDFANIDEELDYDSHSLKNVGSLNHSSLSPKNAIGIDKKMDTYSVSLEGEDTRISDESKGSSTKISDESKGSSTEISNESKGSSTKASNESKGSSSANFQKQVNEIMEERIEKQLGNHLDQQLKNTPQVVIGPYQNLLPRTTSLPVIRISPPTASDSLISRFDQNALTSSPIPQKTSVGAVSINEISINQTVSYDPSVHPSSPIPQNTSMGAPNGSPMFQHSPGGNAVNSTSPLPPLPFVSDSNAVDHSISFKNVPQLNNTQDESFAMNSTGVPYYQNIEQQSNGNERQPTIQSPHNNHGGPTPLYGTAFVDHSMNLAQSSNIPQHHGPYPQSTEQQSYGDERQSAVQSPHNYPGGSNPLHGFASVDNSMNITNPNSIPQQHGPNHQSTEQQSHGNGRQSATQNTEYIDRGETPLYGNVAIDYPMTPQSSNIPQPPSNSNEIQQHMIQHRPTTAANVNNNDEQQQWQYSSPKQKEGSEQESVAATNQEMSTIIGQNFVDVNSEFSGQESATATNQDLSTILGQGFIDVESESVAETNEGVSTLIGQMHVRDEGKSEIAEETENEYTSKQDVNAISEVNNQSKESVYDDEFSNDTDEDVFFGIEDNKRRSGTHHDRKSKPSEIKKKIEVSSSTKKKTLQKRKKATKLGSELDTILSEEESYTAGEDLSGQNYSDLDANFRRQSNNQHKYYTKESDTNENYSRAFESDRAIVVNDSHSSLESSGYTFSFEDISTKEQSKVDPISSKNDSASKRGKAYMEAPILTSPKKKSKKSIAGLSESQTEIEKSPSDEEIYSTRHRRNKSNKKSKNKSEDTPLSKIGKRHKAHTKKGNDKEKKASRKKKAKNNISQSKNASLSSFTLDVLPNKRNKKFASNDSTISSFEQNKPDRRSFLNTYTCGVLGPPRDDTFREISPQSISNDEEYTNDSNSLGDDTGTTNTRSQKYDSGSSNYSSNSESRSASDSAATSAATSVATSSGESETADSKTVLTALSEKEREVWNEWEQKNKTSNVADNTNPVTHDNDPKINSKKKKEHLQHRARSHEKLLVHAYAALSYPPPKTMMEKGQVVPSSSNGIIAFGGDQYFKGDTDNIISPNSQYYESDGENNIPKNLIPANVQDGTSPKFQRQILEQFCNRIKNDAMEVLKLNRESKWQPRYLTVSKEGNTVGRGRDSSTFFPHAMLWVKKFSSTKEHSVSGIGKQGKGGMLLSQLTSVNETNEFSKYPLTKRQQAKFAESCIIRLYRGGSQPGFVTLRCTKADAFAIINGCNAIIALLRMTPVTNTGSASISSKSENGDKVKNMDHHVNQWQQQPSNSGFLELEQHPQPERITGWENVGNNNEQHRYSGHFNSDSERIRSHQIEQGYSGSNIQPELSERNYNSRVERTDHGYQSTSLFPSTSHLYPENTSSGLNTGSSFNKTGPSPPPFASFGPRGTPPISRPSRGQYNVSPENAHHVDGVGSSMVRATPVQGDGFDLWEA